MKKHKNNENLLRATTNIIKSAFYCRLEKKRIVVTIALPIPGIMGFMCSTLLTCNFCFVHATIKFTSLPYCKFVIVFKPDSILHVKLIHRHYSTYVWCMQSVQCVVRTYPYVHAHVMSGFTINGHSPIHLCGIHDIGTYYVLFTEGWIGEQKKSFFFVFHTHVSILIPR